MDKKAKSIKKHTLILLWEIYLLNFWRKIGVPLKNCCFYMDWTYSVSEIGMTFPIIFKVKMEMKLRDIGTPVINRF